MELRSLAYAVAALSFAGFASAQQRLGDLEMDAVTAGLAPFTTIDCPACAVASSRSMTRSRTISRESIDSMSMWR